MYEEESDGLGDRLWSEIQAAISLISTHPAIGQAVQRVRGAVRRVPLRHFPFPPCVPRVPRPHRGGRSRAHKSEAELLAQTTGRRADLTKPYTPTLSAAAYPSTASSS